MPPRYSYWTIIAGGLPTAFRAAEREELMPTFQRLREKHPDAELKWFARGKLWASPEAARPARREQGDRGARGARERDARGPRGPAGDDRSGGPSRQPEPSRGEHRGRDWRPGGDHRDPRQPFKDAKKARNQRWREEKFERKQRFAGAHRDRDRGPSADRRGGPSGPPEKDWKGCPPREKPRGDKFRPRGDRPSRHGQERRGALSASVPDQRGGWSGLPDNKHARPPRQRPHGDKFTLRGDRPTHHNQERRGRPPGSPDDWQKNLPRQLAGCAARETPWRQARSGVEYAPVQPARTIRAWGQRRASFRRPRFDAISRSGDRRTADAAASSRPESRATAEQPCALGAAAPNGARDPAARPAGARPLAEEPPERTVTSVSRFLVPGGNKPLARARRRPQSADGRRRL